MKQIQINEKELIEAPIDEINVLVDSIMESLFDEADYALEGRESVGFVGGNATYAKYRGNEIEIKLIGDYPNEGIRDIWCRSIVDKFTEVWLKEDLDDKKTIMFLDDETNKNYPEEQLIYVFVIEKDIMKIRFYWNNKK